MPTASPNGVCALRCVRVCVCTLLIVRGSAQMRDLCVATATIASVRSCGCCCCAGVFTENATRPSRLAAEAAKQRPQTSIERVHTSLWWVHPEMRATKPLTPPLLTKDWHAERPVWFCTAGGRHWRLSAGERRQTATDCRRQTTFDRNLWFIYARAFMLSNILEIPV